MKIAEVMTEVADRADGWAGLRAYDWPVPKAEPPALVLLMPDRLTFDETYGRGTDRIELTGILMVGPALNRSSRDQLSRFCEGAGQYSLKERFESHPYVTFDSLRLTDIQFDAYTMGGVDYAGAALSFEIFGKGTR